MDRVEREYLTPLHILWGNGSLKLGGPSRVALRGEAYQSGGTRLLIPFTLVKLASFNFLPGLSSVWSLSKRSG